MTNYKQDESLDHDMTYQIVKKHTVSSVIGAVQEFYT